MLLASDIFIGGGALATHPPLAERIRRIFGRPMPALPSPVLAQSAPVDGAADIGAPIALERVDARGVCGGSECGSGTAIRQRRHQHSRNLRCLRTVNWIDDLLQIALPFDLTPATLAFLVRAGNDAELQAWHGLFAELQTPRRDRLLAQVAGLGAGGASARARAPADALCRACRWPSARALRHQAHRIVLADGHLSLLELWRCLLLDHVLDLAHESVLRETHVLSLEPCAAAIHVVSDGAGLAAPRRARRRAGAGTAVAPMPSALALEPGAATRAAGVAPPSLGALTAAMRQLAQLAPMRRPQLLKTWCALVRRRSRWPAAQAAVGQPALHLPADRYALAARSPGALHLSGPHRCAGACG